MRRLVPLLWLTLLAGVPAWSQNFYYLPVAADGVGPNGSMRTSIFIGNATSSAAKVAIVWTQDDGSARQVTLADLGRDSKFAITLAPGATRILQTDGSGANLSGAAVIGSDQNIGVWGILSTFDSAGVLVGETGFASTGISPGFRIPVDSTLGLNTGLVLYNPGPGAASIKASLVDSSGAAAGSATATLAAGARIMRFVSGDWFGALGDFRGTLNLSSSLPLAAQVVRQNDASPVSAILEAPPLISNRLRFYLPQLADGPSTTATLHTTFLLTNLAAKPAAVKMTLTLDDGSPWSVTMPGMDPNSVFQTTIAPGASTFWQTGGTGDYATGAASIRSDRPLGVQALVTASDDQGATISETAAVDAKRQQRFTLPFDSSADPTSGAAFYNTGTKPVALTLTLRDTDGKIAASTQLAPLAPGGQIAGAISDFFPGVSIPRGALSADTGGPAEPFVAAVAMRQNQSLPWSSTLPARLMPLAGVPIKVTSAVDTKRAVTADIGPKGGSLSLTDAAGNKFNLTIPPNALFSTQTIVMTPVTAATGVPGSGLVAVQLAPDGLALLAPATLAILPAAAPPAGTLTPVGWYGANPGVYLNLQQPKAGQTTLLLTHFSYGGGSYFRAGDLTSVLLNIIDVQAYYSGEAAAILAENRAAQKLADAMGQTGPPMPQEFYDVMEAEYTEVIEPLMEIALASQDDDTIRCALQHALGYLRQNQLLALDEEDANAAIFEFAATGIQIQNDHAEKRCKDQHDFTALQDILGLQRQAQLFGLPLSSSDVSALQKDCPDKLQLDFSSAFSSKYTPGGDFKGQISAKFVLNGNFDKTVLTQVSDPSKDLFASYLLSGQATEVYDSVSFAPPLDKSCVSTTKGSAGQMRIVEQAGKNKSQVQFMFSAGYDPAPFSISGTQLCSFCPVYQKTPVKVELLMDPGIPMESITIVCPDDAPVILPAVYWRDGWDHIHPADETGFSFLPKWELPPSHDPFAQMKSLEILSSNRVSVIETTTIKLARPTAP